MLKFDRPAELHGEALESEIHAAGWPDAQVSVAGDVLRVADVTDDDRDGVKAVVDNHVPPDPPPDPDAELASAIEGVRGNTASDDVKALCDALLGNLGKGRVSGRATRLP